jgi:hypothetical protein
MHKPGAAITIERLDQTNIGSLPVLYHAVYGRKVTTAFFQKKYETGYGVFVYAGYIAYTNGRKPIGFFGAIPCELVYNEKIISAAQLTDFMTDPAHRSKALVVQLHEKMTGLCKQNNVHFLFGFSNQHSLPVFRNRFAWDEYGKMDVFSIPVRAIPWEKFSRKFSVFTSAYTMYRKQVLKRYSVSPATNVPSTDPGIYKSDQYSQYKCRGSTVISIGHALVRIKIRHGMMIGEISVPRSHFDDVMSTLKKLACKLGVDKLVFHCSTGSELHGLFAERYESIPSFTIVSKGLGAGIPLDTLKFVYGDIDIF